MIYSARPQKAHNNERNAKRNTRDGGEAIRPPENGWRKHSGGGGGLVRRAEGLP